MTIKIWCLNAHLSMREYFWKRSKLDKIVIYIFLKTPLNLFNSSLVQGVYKVPLNFEQIKINKCAFEVAFGESENFTIICPESEIRGKPSLKCFIFTPF